MKAGPQRPDALPSLDSGGVHEGTNETGVLETAHATSNLLEASCCVCVQQAGDQGLIGQSLGERPLLDRLQILARQTNIESPVLAERRLGVARSFALATTGGLPLALLDGLSSSTSVALRLIGPMTSSRTVPWPTNRPKFGVTSSAATRLRNGLIGSGDDPSGPSMIVVTPCRT